MPALIPTSFTAKITWLGQVADSTVDIQAAPIQQLDAKIGGVVGEYHSGVTRASCSRVTSQYPKGTEIANVRQFSVVSAEELAVIADKIGVEAIDPAWIGASMVIEGIPDFTHVPPSSRLQSSTGATLVIDMENRPCIYPAKVIEDTRPGHGKAFKAAAKNMRGVTAWVERAGVFQVGDTVTLHVPDQPAWAHLKTVRS